MGGPRLPATALMSAPFHPCRTKASNACVFEIPENFQSVLCL